jgi:DNA polymerase delta subunit 2
MLVTGCIIAVMGTENANGDFEVVDIKVPGLPPQPARWSSSSPPTATNGSGRKVKRVKVEDEDEDMDGVEPRCGSKIAIVSGLSFSGTNAEYSLQINLLVEFLLGEALDPTSQKALSQINRLIIAGNSLATDIEALSHDTTGNTRKAHKKYGYDSSAYNPAPTAHLDNFLAELLPSMPVTLIPGASDPANVSFPQQPIHTAMLPHARAYAAHLTTAADEERVPDWFDSVTNPWEAEVDGWRVLGTGGQNVDDIFKYVESEDRLGMLEAICRWRCCAPTAPDTLCEFSIFFIAPIQVQDKPRFRWRSNARTPQAQIPSNNRAPQVKIPLNNRNPQL